MEEEIELQGCLRRETAPAGLRCLGGEEVGLLLSTSIGGSGPHGPLPGTDVPAWPTAAASATSPAALRRALPIADPGRGLSGTDPATLPLAAPESKEEGQDHRQAKVI